MKEKLPSLVRLLGLLALLALPLLSGWLALEAGWLSPQTILNAREDLRQTVEDHVIISLLAYFAIYTAAVAMALPGAVILTLMGGFLFGPLLGGFTTLFAATFGACLIFLLARGILRDHFAARGAGLAHKLQSEFTKNAFNYLLFLRLVPVFPFFLVNIVPAFTKVPLRTYFSATWLGILPGTFAFAFIGAGLDGLIAKAGGTQDFRLSGLLQPELLWGFAFLGLLSLLPVLWKRKSQA